MIPANTTNAAATTPTPTPMEGVISTSNNNTFVSKISRAVNLLMADLCQELSRVRIPKHQNIILLSPVIVDILTKIYAIAPTSLRERMQDLMHMAELSGDNWHLEVRNWITQLCRVNVFYKLNFGSLVTSKLAIKPENSRQLDINNPRRCVFNAPEQAIDLTNQLVNEITQGRIPRILESLSSEDVLVMASAALLETNWEEPFNIKNTKEDQFVNSDGTTVIVQMMHKEEKTLFACEHGMKIMEKKYKGNISMILITPDTQNGNQNESIVDRLQKFMAPANLQRFIENRQGIFSTVKEVHIYLPKTHFSDKSNLKEELKNHPLLKEIITANFADAFVDNVKPMIVSQLQSATDLEIDEIGTKMAGAAAAVVRRESTSGAEMRLNQPFAFVMIDHSNTILSMGQVLKLEQNLSTGVTVLRDTINHTVVDSYHHMMQKRLVNNQNFILFTQSLMPGLALLNAIGPDSLQKWLNTKWQMKGLDPKSFFESVSAFAFILQRNMFTVENTLFSRRPLADSVTSLEENFNIEEFQGNREQLDQTISKATSDNIKEWPKESRTVIYSSTDFTHYWETKFDEVGKKGTFLNNDGSITEVNTASVRENVKIYEYMGMEIVEKPYFRMYGMGNIYLYIIKPSKTSEGSYGESLKKFMTEDNLQEMFKIFKASSVKVPTLVTLPQLKMDENLEIFDELKDTDLGKALSDADFCNAFASNESGQTRMKQFKANIHFELNGEGWCKSEITETAREFTVDRPFGLVMLKQHGPSAEHIIGMMAQINKMS